MHGQRDMTRDEVAATLAGLLVEFGDRELRRAEANGLPLYDKRQPLRFAPTGRRYSFSAGRFNYHAANFVLRRADVFPVAICQSGVYDVSVVGWGERGVRGLGL